MHTPVHGMLASLFSRWSQRPWTRTEHHCLIMGAMIPDAPIVCGWLNETYRYYHRNTELVAAKYTQIHFVLAAYHQTRSDLGYHHRTWALDGFFHEAIVWAGLFLLGFLVPRLAKYCYPLAASALIFHLFVDALTHTFFRRAYLWPFLPHGFSGFMSEEYLRFLLIELVITIVWLVDTLWRYRRRRIEKMRRLFFVRKLMCALRDLNPRPTPCKGVALPLS